MSVSVKKEALRDETRLGEHAATQPVSGTRIVGQAAVKGFGNISFTRPDDSSTQKK
ncbi:MAG: hypothetical protein P4M15_09695 [Alphaproteobacteria bacterium]|nr:hypothetical protein [Alphaproteobacteria bacterium]